MRKPSALARLGLLLCLFLPALSFWADEASPEISVLAPEADAEVREESVRQMHEHLQAIDRRIRTRLLAISKGRHSEGKGKVTAEEVEHLQRHLRSLERRLHSGSDGAELLPKVRSLRPLVGYLQRAIERDTRAGSPDLTEDAGLYRRLSVEWPAPESRQLKGAPANDDCTDATPIGDGTYFGDTTTATADGESCSSDTPDVWFVYTASETARIVADTFGSGYDTVLSVHHGCPGTYDNQLDCNDNVFSFQSAVSFHAEAGENYLIRVSGSFGASGPFVLNVEPGGVITGTVTDDATGEPVAGIEVAAQNAEGILTVTVTGPDGAYEIPGLPAVDHFVFIGFGQDYLPEVYDDVPCDLRGGCEPLSGTPIPVIAGTTTGGIDIAVHRGGSISGTVIDRETGMPPAGFPPYISLWTRDGRHMDVGVHADSSGNYFLDGLYAGTYYAVARSDEYLDVLYDDVPCLGGPGEGGCELSSGTLVEVDFNTITGGIDFELERLGAISGSISDAVTGFPLASANVEIWDGNGGWVRGSADNAGLYQVGGLPPGNYFVFTHTSDHFDELFDDLPCDPVCDPTTGTPVPVSLNTITPDIDFQLERLGVVTGTVTHAVTGQPLSGIHITVFDALGQGVDFVTTGASGSYLVDGLLPGNYTAVAGHFDFSDELYDNLPCEGGCDPTMGTPISVSNNSSAQDIDFDLADLHPRYCTPTATSLCLTGDRFRVEATWENFENQMGPGFADRLTADAGTFWFFNPGNTELVVKILDVCDRPENRFWVFGAGLTDVGVELRVTDELTGEVVTYDNPVGTPYEPVLDTQAFATCDAGFQIGRSESVIPAPAAEALNLPAKGGCLPGANTLCLNGSRFQAEVTWQAPNGDGGVAGAVSLADETGYFYFGGPDNVEVVVKVLDACALPSNKFWVFGAGLTNFEVTLTVTDTVSDVTRVYTNDQGTTFEAITDTSAFDTCDAR